MISARHGLLLLALLLPIAPARAVIGDDLPTLRTAYGSAAQVGGQMLFKHAGLSIAVYFDGTRSAMEIFSRDGSDPKKPEISQDDVDAILTLEGAGQKWHPVTTHSGQPTWLREDSKIIARFNTSEKIVSVIENAK